MNRIITLLLFLSITGIANQSLAQVPTCGINVPFFQVDLTGQPEGEWISPSHSRVGNCCGTSSPDRCTSFEIILDPDAAMINFEIASGAIPPGSMFYQIDCGPQVAVGSPICISGVGPHHLTFCKPGNNENTYRVTSIAKPTFPADDSTRIGCSLPVSIYGLMNISINSISPGTPGQYNSYLSCTNCSTPDFAPGLGSPAFIDYQICGTPIASACGYVYTCDTVRLYAFQALDGNVTPNPASFCNGGPGVTLTASASGGNSVYSYTWYNSSSTQVGTGSTYNATAQENFTVAINDGLSSATCPAEYITVPVTVGQPPVVIAGPAQLVCANDPIIYLNGNVSDATGGVWTGGAGTFDPNDSTLFASYTPTSAEINSGSLTLTLTSYGAGGGCTDDSDQVTITFSDTTDIAFTTPSLACYNSTGTITSSVSNGTPPYTYQWSTNSSATSINVGAGSYWLDITDAIGCIHQENVTLTAPAALGVTLSSTDVSVDGGSDGTATAIPSGGTPPYSYLWSNGNTTSTATGLSYGVATVIITDANGCMISESIVVNEPRCNGYAASATATDVSCFGGSDGTASASVTGGLAPFAYSWNTSPVTLTSSVSGLTAGSYTVTVTDDNACIDVVTISVSEPAQLTNSMTHTDIPVIGDNTGVATANPAGGTPGYTYQWTPGGETTQSITNLFAGTYHVDIADANLCAISDSIIINEPPCNNFNIGIISNNVSCNGLSDGSARVVIAHGVAPYIISWSNGQTGITATNLTAGTYTVTVTDASNCTTFESVTITEPSSLSIGLTPTQISCFGAGDGTIDLTVSGGTFPYSFSWSTGSVIISTAEDLVTLKPATYSITVTDANGCTGSGSVGITQPSLLTASSVKINATCNGDLNGSINATVTGGTSPYSYAWTGPGSYSASSEDINTLGAGLYTLNVTDQNNCTLSPVHEVYINQPDTVIIQSILVDCPTPGGSTVTVHVDSITGGTETTYNVSFNNGVIFLGYGVYTTTLAVNNTYQVVAEDQNGCATFAPYNLTIDPTIFVDTVIFDPCIPTGATSISVSVTPVGGDGGPYEVSTDNGSTFNTPGTTVISLATGNSYNIVVKDSKGCLSPPYAITIPNELITSAVISSEVSCLGESDGSINLTVTGGTTPYVFNWTGPSGYTASTEDLSGLIEGNYSVIVTDNNGCISNTSILLTTITDITDPVISCPADISVSTDAGLCGATVTYLTPVGTDNCPLGTYTIMTAGLASGSFFTVGITTTTYVVTDSVGNNATCSFLIEVTDNENPTIICPADVAITNDPGTCEAATVSLGTPVTNDNCGVATVTNDAPATFLVGTTTVTWTVTDIHGNSITCTQDVVVTDNENPTIICPADVAVNNDPGTCEAATISLGTPVTNDNCGVATVTNDAPSTFLVGTTTVTWTVTDIHGNSLTCTQDVVVTDNENPTIICPADVAVNNNPGTCEAATVSLGTPVTNDNCGVATVTNDAPTTFLVGTTTVTWTVTDIHGNSLTCTQDVVVTDNENPTIICPSDVAVNNDPGTCEAATVSLGTPVTNDNCGVATVTNDAPSTFLVGTTTVTWTVTDIHANSITCTQDVVVTDNENPTIICPADVAVNNDPGTCEAATVSLGTPVTNDNCGVATVTNDAPAIFLVGTTTVTWTVTDIHGNSLTCTQDVVVTDNENPTIICPADVAVNNDPGTCEAATVSLGTPVTNDNCGVATVTNDAPSTFPVGTTTVTWTVTDIHGNSLTCTQDVVVTDNENPVTTNCPSDTSSCFPLVNYILPTATDNCGIASIIQTAGLGSGALFPVGTTIEEYEITDIHGNITVCSFTVTIHPTPVAAITGDDVTCYAAADGTIDLTVTNGTSPYSYLWSNGAVTEDLANLVPDVYDVVVTDFNGCETTAALNITQPDTITVEMTHSDVTCNGLSNGTITIIPDGGTTPYNYSWSNGSTSQNLTGLTAGTYSLTLTDDNGCTYQLISTVIQPDSLYATSTTTDATCLSSTGTIDLTVNGGTTPYIYNWSNSVSTQDLVNVPSGNYSVTITDANGCQLVYTDSIESVNPVSINSTIQDVLCYGDRNGRIDVTVLNATEPIHYYWSTGDSTSILLNLLAGDYTLTAVDDNQCSITVTYTIEQPDSLYIQLSSPVHTGGFNVSTYGGTDGSVDAEVTGGISPYEYLWSDGSTSEDLNNISAGQYAVLVTDQSGCTVQASILLTQPFELEMPNGYSPNNDGENDFFVIHGIEAFPDNEIEIYNRWGNLVYSATGYQNEWDGYNNSGEELPDGTYFVILKITALDRALTGYVDLRRTR